MRKLDLSKIPEILATDPNVVAAWLFGSGQSGHIRPGSDLDIAVLFVAYPTLDERCHLADRIESVLTFGDIDLVVLNGTSVILRFEALNGRRIYCTDPEAVATFQSVTSREYEHAMWMIERGMKWHQETIQAQVPA